MEHSGSVLREGMGGLSERLQTSLRQSSLMEHALTKGEFRESEVAEAFRPHLPRRWELSSGLVVNPSGQQSQQQDLIISDTFFVSPFVASGGVGLHPVETVSGIFEVKSRGTSASVRDGVQKIASVKALSSDEPTGVRLAKPGAIEFREDVVKPFGAIVCLASEASADTLVAAYLDSLARVPTVHRPNALLVLDVVTALWAKGPNEYSFFTRPDGAERLMQWNAGSDSLFLFYLTLLAALRDAPEPALNLEGYLEQAEVPAQGKWFRAPPDPAA